MRTISLQLNNWDALGVAEYIDAKWHNIRSEKEHRQLLSNIVDTYISPGGTLLDVGCGSGYFYEQLSVAVPNIVYTGIDSSNNMLAIARQRFPKVNFLNGDIFSLDFTDSTFDVVVSFEVLGHLQDIVKPISELIRVAKKYVLFTVWTGYETIKTDEVHMGEHFLHYVYSNKDVLSSIPIKYKITNPFCGLYVITK